ncbi:unnamed protein product [Merluccius merluccius]
MCLLTASRKSTSTAASASDLKPQDAHDGRASVAPPSNARTESTEERSAQARRRQGSVCAYLHIFLHIFLVPKWAKLSQERWK